MAKDPEEMKSGGIDLPVVMSWIGTHRLCLTKEEAAKRRPPNSSSMPVAFDRIEISPRHLLKTPAVYERATSDDETPPARSDS